MRLIIIIIGDACCQRVYVYSLDLLISCILQPLSCDQPSEPATPFSFSNSLMSFIENSLKILYRTIIMSNLNRTTWQRGNGQGPNPSPVHCPASPFLSMYTPIFFACVCLVVYINACNLIAFLLRNRQDFINSKRSLIFFSLVRLSLQDGFSQDCCHSYGSQHRHSLLCWLSPDSDMQR